VTNWALDNREAVRFYNKQGTAGPKKSKQTVVDGRGFPVAASAPTRCGSGMSVTGYNLANIWWLVRLRAPIGK
jgi:hypothetical protein